MRPEFAAGSDHRLTRHNKPTLMLESGDKYRIFQRVIILVETARRLEGAARAEQAGSARQKAQEAHHTCSERLGQPPPKGQPPVEPWHTTTADRTRANAAQSRLNG